MECSRSVTTAIHAYGCELQRLAWALVAAAREGQKNTTNVSQTQVEEISYREGASAKDSSASPPSRTSLFEGAPSEISGGLTQPPKQMTERKAGVDVKDED